METNADILKYWNYEKNINDNPSNYSVGSGKVVWWKCEKGHEWEQQIYQFSKKNEKCPYCSNKKLLIGFNDFASCYKDLLKEWNYKKNRIKPDEIIKTSPIKVWWKCSVCDHEWSNPEYDPEEQEIKVVEDVWYGVDVWPEERGTGRYRKVDRWSRVCKKCGKKEYTYEMEKVPVKTVSRPKFK